MKSFSAIFLTLAGAFGLHAAIQSQLIEYKQGDTTIAGVLVYDDAVKKPRPGVLVAHQWLGLTDYERGRARQLAELKKSALVDAKRAAAIGYCFGDTAVLELARSGAELNGVVSLHGGLDSPAPADGKNIKCAVLACHGADDPFVKPEDLAAFEAELRDAKVDWQLIKYGGAVHSFTQLMAANDNSKGAAYNQRADERSWADMKQFFGQILK